MWQRWLVGRAVVNQGLANVGRCWRKDGEEKARELGVLWRIRKIKMAYELLRLIYVPLQILRRTVAKVAGASLLPS